MSLNQYAGQQSYFETRLQSPAQALQPYLWGVLGVEWDTAALERQVLRLRKLSAVFRSGCPCDAPAVEALPPAVDLGTLPAGLQEVTYYAAMYTSTADGSLPVPGAPGGAHRTLRLLLNLEPHGSCECFPLIRLRRNAAGAFEADPAFLPPGLSVASAPRLKARLERLVDALQAKAATLQDQLREPGREAIATRAGDVPAFWLLHAVSTASATLMHYLRHPALHPERLFEAMLELAGALMPLSGGNTPASLPAYQHEHPGPGFAQLDGMIRALLDAARPERCTAIPLAEDRPCYYRAELDARRVGRNAMLYLAIEADLPAARLAELAPLCVKAGAPDDVDQCVQFAMQGIKLSYVPQPPAAIPAQPGICYFILENENMRYERMLQAQSVSVYVPDAMPGLRIGLLAVAP